MRGWYKAALLAGFSVAAGCAHPHTPSPSPVARSAAQTGKGSAVAAAEAVRRGATQTAAAPVMWPPPAPVAGQGTTLLGPPPTTHPEPFIYPAVRCNDCAPSFPGPSAAAAPPAAPSPTVLPTPAAAAPPPTALPALAAAPPPPPVAWPTPAAAPPQTAAAVPPPPEPVAAPGRAVVPAVIPPSAPEADMPPVIRVSAATSHPEAPGQVVVRLGRDSVAEGDAPQPSARGGHAADYSWLVGELQYLQTRHAWRLCYGRPGAEDRYGGTVTLAGDALPPGAAAGQVVRVEGRLVNPGTSEPRPAYWVERVQVLKAAPNVVD